jgi:hypothetical protein
MKNKQKDNSMDDAATSSSADTSKVERAVNSELNASEILHPLDQLKFVSSSPNSVSQ